MKKNYIFTIIFLYFHICYAVKLPDISKQKIAEDLSKAVKESIIKGGDFLIRHQLKDGQLLYSVDIKTGKEKRKISHTRLVAGIGSLYTVFQVTKDEKYLKAADKALKFYFKFLETRPNVFNGTCFFEDVGCYLGGTSLFLDVIYRKFKATGKLKLGNVNLLDVARRIGKWFRYLKDDQGSLNHYMDVHTGIIDKEYKDSFYNGEAMLACLELFEMTKQKEWLEMGKRYNEFLKKTVKIKDADHWQGYGFRMLATLKEIDESDLDYADKLLKEFDRSKERYYVGKNSDTISSGAGLEGMAACAIALMMNGKDSSTADKLGPQIFKYVTKRQYPNNDCQLKPTKEQIKKLSGGIFASCLEDGSEIRIDGVQHYINGAKLFMDYLELKKKTINK